MMSGIPTDLTHSTTTTAASNADLVNESKTEPNTLEREAQAEIPCIQVQLTAGSQPVDSKLQRMPRCQPWQPRQGQH